MSIKGHIFGLVHPILDITMNVDQLYLDQYGLKADNGILASEAHASIYADMLEKSRELGVRFSPGGTTQNCVRVAQWYLDEEEATSMVGCIGGDSYGEHMRTLVKNEGVKTEYFAKAGMSTGICAVLVSPGHNRSLVTQLGAARTLGLSQLKKVWSLVEQARILVCTAFLLNDALEVVIAVGEHAVAADKCFIFNLGAPYLSAVFTDEMRRVLKFSDVVLGNREEALALARNFGMDSKNIHEIIVEIADLPKENTGRSRVVIITQGSGNILVFENGDLKEFPVPAIPLQDIVDTNGAGDGFVGGFLSKLVRGHNMDTCVNMGIKAAHMIMGVPGCTLLSTVTSSQVNPEETLTSRKSC